MKKSEFISVLKVESSLNKINLDELNSILTSFPYFTSAHIIKSKYLKHTDSIQLESQLRLAAAYSGDRKQLQSHLLNTSAPDIENEETSFNKLETIEAENESQSDFNDDLLDKQILIEAINSSILQEIPNEIDLENDNLITEKADIDIEKEETSIFDLDQSHSFSGWINHYSKDKSEEEKSRSLSIISQTAESIQEKAEFFNASKMAKLSVQEDDDLITETLANVYVQQENYNKAISAFKKLQLKFPEKKIYFAGRIKEVELLTKQ